MTVVKSKNGEKRTIPMSNLTSRFLRDAKVRDISGKVFPVPEKRLGVAFLKTLKKTGISDFRLHDLRHTFATRLVQNGVDLYKVRELLGLKPLQ
jgi:site-specific recombinase XerD